MSTSTTTKKSCGTAVNVTVSLFTSLDYTTDDILTNAVTTVKGCPMKRLLEASLGYVWAVKYPCNSRKLLDVDVDIDIDTEGTEEISRENEMLELLTEYDETTLKVLGEEIYNVIPEELVVEERDLEQEEDQEQEEQREGRPLRLRLRLAAYPKLVAGNAIPCPTNLPPAYHCHEYTATLQIRSYNPYSIGLEQIVRADVVSSYDEAGRDGNLTAALLRIDSAKTFQPLMDDEVIAKMEAMTPTWDKTGSATSSSATQNDKEGGGCGYAFLIIVGTFIGAMMAVYALYYLLFFFQNRKANVKTIAKTTSQDQALEGGKDGDVKDGEESVTTAEVSVSETDSDSNNGGEGEAEWDNEIDAKA